MDDYSPGRSWSLTAIFLFLSIILLLTACSGSGDAGESNDPPPVTSENVIIQCASDCGVVTQQISSLGGTVYKSYQNFPAIAATVPNNLVSRLQSSAPVKAIDKDFLVARPSPRHVVSLSNVTTRPNLFSTNLNTALARDFLITAPANYNFNNSLTGATQLHNMDITGSGVVVAVIDTGTANNGDVVPALEGSVIGGENFVDFPNEPSATSTLNDDHGTWVGSMIASHLGIVLPGNDELVQSLMVHAPDSVLPFNNNEFLVPMMGSAPKASIYALKVFAAEGDGAAVSTVIEAMDRVLTLKHNYNEGLPSVPVAGDGSEEDPYVYDSLNIQVVNLSLGGPTMFPGHALDDLIALAMLREGITVVSAAGNEGTSAMTGGSPGTSVGSLTVGALNTPQHERILRDLQFGPGTGLLFRPNSQTQIAWFSSRGPTADGRAGVDVVANGFASFVQGADGSISIISGTSFAAPTTAGAAALLWQAKPGVEANQVRMALINSASMDLLANYQSSVIDRGQGVINLPGALALLEQDDFQPAFPVLPILHDEPTRVSRNISSLGLDVIPLSAYSDYTADVNLNAGEVAHFFFESNLDTDQVTVEVINYQTGLPPDEQNQLFGDALFLTLLDAPTSINDILIDERVEDNARFTITKPQSGILRLAVMGDWTNVGGVSATLRVSTLERRLQDEFAEGKLVDEEVDYFRVRVNEDVTTLNVELTWEADWGQYPPHDIDLILFNPDGEPIFDGATLDIPERVSIEGPARGTWTVLVTGFMLHGYRDEYELYVTDQNNNRLRRQRRRRD